MTPPPTAHPRRYGKPIWVTEFDCPNKGGSADRQLAFMRDALSVFDADPWVERYSWFAPVTDGFDWIGAPRGGGAGAAAGSW